MSNDTEGFMKITFIDHEEPHALEVMVINKYT